MNPNWICRIDGGPKKVNHASVIIGHKMYVIGGYSIGQPNSSSPNPIDVHVFCIRKLQWVALFDVSTKDAPFMRYGHTAVAYGSDIYVWGGRNEDRACNILFKLNLVSKQWSKVQTNGHTPIARDGHSSCVIGSKMYVYGGFLDEPFNVFANGLECLDLSTMTWLSVNTTGEDPGCRDFHSATVVGDEMYLFGGRKTSTPPFHYSSMTYPNTMHVWNSKTGAWTEKSSIAIVGRRSTAMFTKGTDIYVIGGFNGILEKHLSDVYRYCTITNKWKEIKPHGIGPSPRRRHTCLSSGHLAILFGGTSPEARPDNMSIHSDDDDNDDDLLLMNHGDVYILDLEPTLLSLCLTAVVKYRLDFTCLPLHLASQIKAMSQSSIGLGFSNLTQG